VQFFVVSSGISILKFPTTRNDRALDVVHFPVANGTDFSIFGLPCWATGLSESMFTFMYILGVLTIHFKIQITIQVVTCERAELLYFFV
jgi:hypothetical protein